MHKNPKLNCQSEQFEWGNKRKQTKLNNKKKEEIISLHSYIQFGKMAWQWVCNIRMDQMFTSVFLLSLPTALKQCSMLHSTALDIAT